WFCRTPVGPRRCTIPSRPYGSDHRALSPDRGGAPDRGTARASWGACAQREARRNLGKASDQTRETTNTRETRNGKRDTWCPKKAILCIGRIPTFSISSIILRA